MIDLLEYANRIPLLDEEQDHLTPNYFDHLDRSLPFGTKIVVYIRNSDYKSIPALPNQGDYAKKRIDQLNYKIVYIRSYNGSGYGDKWFNWLKKNLTEDIALGYKILFLSVCRAVRNPMVGIKYDSVPRIQIRN